jgi:hypothetical protein
MGLTGCVGTGFVGGTGEEAINGVSAPHEQATIAIAMTEPIKTIQNFL